MRARLLALGAALVLAAAGCGSRRRVVPGTVTVDGKPVERGAIQFLPADGAGPTAGGVIENGRYHVLASPGTMKVVINATKVVGHRKLYDDLADSPVIDVVQEVLPAKYSDVRKSELTI